MAEASKVINADQRKRMYGLARELGMSTRSLDQDDDLHLLVAGITGKQSLRSLTYTEAEQIIGELRHRQRFRTDPQPSEKPGGVTIGQQKKIIALMCELRKFDDPPSRATIEQRVSGVIRRELHIEATANAPYQWLNYRHGNKLIEVIKGYLDTAQRKQAKDGGSDVRNG